MKQKVRVDEDGVVRPVMTDDGREIPDSTPMAPPVGFRESEPLHMRIRAMVQHEYELARQRDMVESPEEADDFVIPGEEGDDAREARFALMPGYEWEESYEPPKDWNDMRNRLIEAGWSPPPKPGQEASAEGGDSAVPTEKPLDAAQAPKMSQSPPAGSGKRS